MLHFYMDVPLWWDYNDRDWNSILFAQSFGNYSLTYIYPELQSCIFLFLWCLEIFMLRQFGQLLWQSVTRASSTKHRKKQP